MRARGVCACVRACVRERAWLCSWHRCGCFSARCRALTSPSQLSTPHVVRALVVVPLRPVSAVVCAFRVGIILNVGVCSMLGIPVGTATTEAAWYGQQLGCPRQSALDEPLDDFKRDFEIFECIHSPCMFLLL